MFQAEADQLDADIDRLLNWAKRTLPLPPSRSTSSKAALAQEYKAQYEKQQVEANKLSGCPAQLEAKMTTIKQEREHMLALLELAKARQIAAKTIRSLDDLQGIGACPTSRAWATKSRARLDRADAEMEVQSYQPGISGWTDVLASRPGKISSPSASAAWD